MTSSTNTSVTIEFPGRIPDHVDLPGVETTVIIEYTSETGGVVGSSPGVFGGGSFGDAGPHVGDHVEPGGIITAIDDLTVTVAFPNGVPKGPIELPGIETTVVDKQSHSEETGTPSGEGSPPTFTPAAGAGVPVPPPPVPGSLEADRLRGAQVGQAYGEFLAWAEFFLQMLQEPHGGVSVWDRMSAQERLAAIGKVQSEYIKLPALPKGSDAAHDAALRQGFQERARNSYEAERFMTRAVWTAAELAKQAAVASATSPTPIMIGGAFTTKVSDCAAQTASIIIERTTGAPAVDPGFLQRTFGLPRATISNYQDTVAYAKAWFADVGIQLELQPGGLATLAEGGREGMYVVFLKDVEGGGHVIFGQVSPEGLLLIDNQLGRSWTSLTSAQNALRAQATGAFRVRGVKVPLP